MKFLLLLFLFFSSLVSAKGGDAYKHYSRGVELASHKSYAEAVIQFQKAVDLNPNYMASYIECARALVMLGKRRAGLAELSAGLALARRHDDIEHLQRERSTLSKIFYTNTTFQNYQNGLNYMRLERPSSAVESFEKAYAVEPDNILILLAYAEALDAEDNQKLRQEILEKALKLNDRDKEIRIALADALLLQDPAASMQLSKFVLADRHASEASVILYARALLAQKKNKEALDFLRDRSEKNPSWILSQYWLGKIYAMEPSGNWLARKYLMTFLKREETLPHSASPRGGKSFKLEAEALLTQVNKALE